MAKSKDQVVREIETMHDNIIARNSPGAERALFTIMSYVNYMSTELKPPPTISMHKVDAGKAVMVVDMGDEKVQFLVTVRELPESASS